MMASYLSGSAVDLRVELGEIEPGARGGLRQMIAFVPVVDRRPTRSCD